MSVESSFHSDAAGRPLAASEKRLIEELLKRAGVDLPQGWIDVVTVFPMSDGGMGSLRFLCSSETSPVRQAAELSFQDVDGVNVIASLNLDATGIPSELDIWKVDFSPLVRIPDAFEPSSEKGISDN